MEKTEPIFLCYACKKDRNLALAISSSKKMDWMTPQVCLFSTPKKKKDSMFLILVWFKVKRDLEKGILKNGKE